MKVLIIGGGGREHALAWRCAAANSVETVYVAPGNAGTALESKVENIAIAADNIEALLEFAQSNKIDLTIVGPEAPLVLGIVDQFTAAKLHCFGPTQAAAQLEGSKTFCKNFLRDHNIPTADYDTFTDIDPAIAYIKKMGAPIVVKADGLAAGKGVILAETEQQAIDAVQDMLAGNKFGEAGNRVLIEEFLNGEEASFIVMADGTNILPLATSQDHKAAYDGDTGPNTGGMGAYSPAPVITPELHQRIMRDVIEPTITGMSAQGQPYSGFLYAGIMVTADGTPKVLEYNCRFGDPETQPVLMRLKSDLAQLCLAACQQSLHLMTADWDERTALGVVLAAKGYPAQYPKGDLIDGLDSIPEEHCKIFHAGTVNDNGKVLTAGGRVLCATALGDDIAHAQEQAYQLVNKISWNGMQYRSDIGYRAIARNS
ncbi:Phosphoribosylamine--glycine ligase [hydrothermal vent metagenome]|uniref:Phosphoribosylamine--glycine ligase n=1 Tax=hydrothermal vent metagenome TaxID=652676 RepID=A0A3B0YLC1_9ZZZZ